MFIYFLVVLIKKETEGFDGRYIYVTRPMEPIQYAPLIGEGANWNIHEVATAPSSSAPIRHKFTLKADEMGGAGFGHLNDEHGVNLVLFIPYILDILRIQSGNITKLQESLGKIEEQVYNLTRNS